MKRLFAIIISCMLLNACKPGIPKEIIQPAKMEKVLFDIHVVDGYISMLPTQDTAKRVAASLYKGVYKKFDIDSAVYNQSLNYYYKHPDLMKKMYDNLSNELTKTKDEIAKETAQLVTATDLTLLTWKLFPIKGSKPSSAFKSLWQPDTSKINKAIDSVKLFGPNKSFQ
jgi:hypothetical protein